MRLVYFRIVEKGRDWIFLSFLLLLWGRYSLSPRKGRCNFKDRLRAEKPPLLHQSSTAGSELCRGRGWGRGTRQDLQGSQYLPRPQPPASLLAALSHRTPPVRLRVCHAPHASWVSSLRFWRPFLEKPLAELAAMVVAAAPTVESSSILGPPARGPGLRHDRQKQLAKVLLLTGWQRD